MPEKKNQGKYEIIHERINHGKSRNKINGAKLYQQPKKQQRRSRRKERIYRRTTKTPSKEYYNSQRPKTFIKIKP